MGEMRLECAPAASTHTTACGERLLRGGHFTCFKDLKWQPSARFARLSGVDPLPSVADERFREGHHYDPSPNPHCSIGGLGASRFASLSCTSLSRTSPADFRMANQLIK
jgi:hypothetical protein